MFSQRFDRQIILTDHARQRMSERNVADERLVDLIDSGEIHRKDETRLWITKSYADRQDNLLCAAVVPASMESESSSVPLTAALKLLT